MAKQMMLLPYMTQVVTVVGNYPGMITGVLIRDENVLYEVVYSLDGEHRTVWLPEKEFLLQRKTKKKPVGFQTEQ